MPKRENQTEIYKKLSEYRNVVVENDSNIRIVDYIKGLAVITPTQISRMEEMESRIIPSGIEKEKSLKKEIDELINRAKKAGVLTPIFSAIIELRYFNALEWPEVAEAVYPAWGQATKSERNSYMNRLFKHHSRALLSIEKIMKEKYCKDYTDPGALYAATLDLRHLQHGQSTGKISGT
ncbi:MAG: hypothetical protein IKQ04_03510 [Oscillospiraceae bacterium]|nr:hypothetical protein [Oscillospiraceae bacterium]